MKNKKRMKEEGLYKPQLVGSPGVWWFLFAVLGALSLLAFVTPITTETPEPRPYTVTYDFDYTGVVPPNPVYESSELVYGQPIFLNIVDEIETTVTYSINNPNVRIDNGELILKAILVGSAGWTRVLSESPAVQFSGDTSASSSLSVNFSDALAAADENDQITGTSSTLNVRIIAETYVNGELLQNGKGPGGLDERTTADIVFTLKPESALVMLPNRAPAPGTGMGTAAGSGAGVAPGTAGASSETGSASGETGSASSETGGASTETGYLSTESGYLSIETGGASTETGYLSTETGYLSSETGYLSSGVGEANSGTGTANSGTGGATSGGGGPAGGRPAGGQDPSVKQITQMIPTDVNVPNKINLGFIEIPVETARTFLTAFTLLVLALGIYNTVVMRSVKRRGEVATLVAAYGKRIIPMTEFSISKVKDAVTVPDFESLYAISNETEQLIMIRRSPDGQSAEFFVSDNGTVYKCIVTEDTEPHGSHTDQSSNDEDADGDVIA